MSFTNETFLRRLEKLSSYRSLKTLQHDARLLHQAIQRMRKNAEGKLFNEKEYSIHKDMLLDEMNQILTAKTLPRAVYYIRRLIKSMTEVKTGKINDLNLRRWKEYDDLITDSLWIIPKRDRSGVHNADYWGNFVPQIPNQLIRRYTKQGEWVLDPFLGSGTTLIECKRLGRNGIGVELQASVARSTQARLKKERNPFSIATPILTGDSASLDLKKYIRSISLKSIHLAILHPPYWDIIKFSDNAQDLSNTSSIHDFLHSFGNVVAHVADVLADQRYLAIVISDKYSGGEWIPLGFLTMQEALKHGFKLKSIIVKNFESTKAKRSQEELWRYRALVGGLYVFKHEYIFLLQKKK